MNSWDYKVTLLVQAIVESDDRPEREELFDELLDYLETPIDKSEEVR